MAVKVTPISREYTDGQALAAAEAGMLPLELTNLDIDGGTDIGAALVDADLFIVDDGAGGTNRKTAASRLKTYISVELQAGVAKFWVKYAGDSTTVNASYNVDSVSHPGNGDHTITITTDFSSANWCATMAARTAGVGHDIRVETMTTGSLRVLSSDGSSPTDSTYECIAGFGAQ